MNVFAEEIKQVSNDASTQQTGETQIVTGYDCSAYIDKNKNLWTWGDNNFGQLGRGDSEQHKEPAIIMKDVQQAALGEFFGAAVKMDGSLWTWGLDRGGCLGKGDSEAPTSSPQKIIGSGIKSVSLGIVNGAAVTETGDLLVWGSNGSFQLGDGDSSMTAVLKVWDKPQLLMSNVKATSISGETMAALKPDGSLWTWGNNVSGQLGYTLKDALISANPGMAMDNVKDICMGDGYGTALKKDGTVWTWGSNQNGQLGNGETEGNSAPKMIMEQCKKIGNSSAIDHSDNLWTWGSNTKGQIGDGTTEQRNIPVKVMDNVKTVTRSIKQSGGIKKDETIWMWGDNFENRLGDPEFNDDYSSVPHQIYIPPKTPPPPIEPEDDTDFEMKCLLLSKLTYKDLDDYVSTGQTIDAFAEKVEPVEKEWIFNNAIPSTVKYSALYKQYLKEWIVEATYQEDSGFYAAAFKNKETGQNVFAYRGSQDIWGAGKDDWREDFIYGLLNEETAQMGQAISSLQKHITKYGKDNLVLTGHSLGGGLAIIGSNAMNLKAIPFDSSPTLDVSYYRMWQYLSNSFKGIDQWTYQDHINEHDPIGLFESKYKNITVHENLDPNIISVLTVRGHDLKNLINFKNSQYRLSDIRRTSDFANKKSLRKVTSFQTLPIENLIMEYTKDLATGPAISTIVGKVPYKMMQIGNRLPKGTLVLGSSGLDQLNGSTIPIPHTEVIYGGDGNDELFGKLGDDFLIGGNGNDTLDGGNGKDTYVYWKDQGMDTIYDVSGNDSLEIYGYEKNDAIQIDTSSDPKFIVLKDNEGATVVKISKNRSFLPTNSFDVKMYGDAGEKSVRIQDWNDWSSNTRVRLACPIAVDIYDDSNNLCLTLEDGYEQNYHEDYGNFYVALDEETGEYIKELDFGKEGYSYKVRAIDKGNMDVDISEAMKDGSIKNYQTKDVPLQTGDVFKGTIIGQKPQLVDEKNNQAVKLNENTVIPVEKVVLEKEKLELLQGDSLTLSAKVMPQNATDQKIVWSSSDPLIAEVNEKGKIKAIKEGKVTINAETSDGQNFAVCQLNISVSQFKRGDVDADDAINASDGLMDLRHSVKEIELKDDAFTRGDVNWDQIINASDALQILRYSVKEITGFD